MNLLLGFTALGVVAVTARLFSRRRALPSLSDFGEDGDGAKAEVAEREEREEATRTIPPGSGASKQSGVSQRDLVEFFFWSFALAVPFWVFGWGKLPLPINLPVGALVAVVPVTAASIISYKRHGSHGVGTLLRKALDFRKMKNKAWYIPALLLMPLIYTLSYVFIRLAGLPLPESIEIPYLMAPLFLIMFFAGGLGEELGWTGYATDPLEERFGAVKGALILGIIWALWHSIPYVQTGNPTSWIIWQILYAIALRVLIVWIYNSTGKSVFAATLLHATVNVSWTLFPNYGSHFNPAVTGSLAWLTVLIVMALWRPATPTRYNYASA